jgi:hypothetical protein
MTPIPRSELVFTVRIRTDVDHIENSRVRRFYSNLEGEGNWKEIRPSLERLRFRLTAGARIGPAIPSPPESVSRVPLKSSRQQPPALEARRQHLVHAEASGAVAIQARLLRDVGRWGAGNGSTPADRTKRRLTRPHFRRQRLSMARGRRSVARWRQFRTGCRGNVMCGPSIRVRMPLDYDSQAWILNDGNQMIADPSRQITIATRTAFPRQPDAARFSSRMSSVRPTANSAAA